MTLEVSMESLRLLLMLLPYFDMLQLPLLCYFLNRREEPRNRVRR